MKEKKEIILNIDSCRYAYIRVLDKYDIENNFMPASRYRRDLYSPSYRRLLALSENQEIEVSGDLAVVRGVYSLTAVPKADGDPIPVDGKYMSVLKKQPDGEWKLYRDIFNSNVSAQ